MGHTKSHDNAAYRNIVMDLMERFNADGPLLLEWLSNEMARADSLYGEFRSTHEALGVLIEEFDELRAAIHANSLHAIELEAMQIAAVSLRLVRACHSRVPVFRERSGA